MKKSRRGMSMTLFLVLAVILMAMMKNGGGSRTDSTGQDVAVVSESADSSQGSSADSSAADASRGESAKNDADAESSAGNASSDKDRQTAQNQEKSDAGSTAAASSDAGSTAAGSRNSDAQQGETYTFRNSSLLNQHYNKHGKDMGFASAGAYEQAASDVVNNPDALHKTEAEDGDDVYYVEDTNDFVIVSRDGYLRTYFRPDAGIRYYNRQ